MRLVLLRHGRTAANEARLYCGATDVALSEAGRAQLLLRRERVRYPEIDGLLRVTSGMLRADETLRILFGAEPELRLPGLREMNFGRFEMHSYEQLKEDAGYQKWIMDASGDVSTPGGESTNAFHRRVNAAFDGLRRDALVVCHGGVIAARMGELFPQENKNLYQWQPDSGLGYVLEENGGKWSYTTIGEECKMRHPDREITDIQEIAKVFERADTIRIGMHGGDYPYVVPVSFGWELVDGKIAVYFHGARCGRKYDLLRQDPRVCVEADVLNGYVPVGDSYTSDYESAIGFGEAESLTGAEAVHGMQLLLRHCGMPEDGAERCILRNITEMTRVVLVQVTGKRRFRK